MNDKQNGKFPQHIFCHCMLIYLHILAWAHIGTACTLHFVLFTLVLR